ncbi:unnamed protein product [Periconia digitata]|uniref:CT20-domain-containing protein n=1 Tax=Periconia digitata TaxID=1303443 RepID=A0A9W4XJC2_9PLEO|nr:unnamed protein product [Periconia digitata]
MPPRKRAKPSAASTPLADTQAKTPQPHDTTAQAQELLHDPWADEQETQLFKSMMKWKPTGIHKHFRMISIHADMRSHGFATDDAPHTRIPGIWRKLHQLYDLHALDDRENSYAFGEDADPHDPEDAANMDDFELPEEDYGELIWQSRFDGSGSSSPPLMPVEDEKALYHPSIGLLKDEPGGVLSQKVGSAASASASASAPKSAKTTRASRAAAKNTKATKGQTKNTRAQAAVSDSVEEEEEDEEEDDDEDDEEGSSSESEEETAPSTRRTNRSTAKAKPAPKRTRKR